MTCISIKDEIVHGIPRPRRLEPGDVRKVDVTAELGGYIADAATTILLPPISINAIQMKQAASAALRAGLRTRNGCLAVIAFLSRYKDVAIRDIDRS